MTDILPSCRFCDSKLSNSGLVCGDNPELNVLKCKKCNLVQLSDFSHIDEEYYSSDVYVSEALSINNITDLQEAREREREWNQKRVHIVEEVVPHAKEYNVLDFGCGHGGFLMEAQGLFKNLVGFDLSAYYCAQHREQGWNAISNLDDLQFDIDMIVLYHVLEHLKLPWNTLKELIKRFKTARTVIIEVPNTNEVLNSVFNNKNYQKNHYSSGHLYYFAHETLRNIVEGSGLEVTTETGIQRYSIANNLGWLARGKGGGQIFWDYLDDEVLNTHYERILVERNIADSIFFICNVAS